MKNITLKSLSLKNFRGEKERITNFSPVETTISGENGLGKSRHFDAFMWLLFGKDSQDRKDYNIKTIVDGKTVDKLDCEVSGILSIDGEEINLRRAYVEKWVKPRGQIEEVFKGNETECYWNDTPVSVTEYQKRINAIIDDSVFKMVTNPLFFANMKWQDQREQLFQLAGTITDSEIASGNSDYIALLDRVSGKSLIDFKRELSARKKRLKDDLAQIQPRIDQTRKLMPEPLDFANIEAKLKTLEAQYNEVDMAIGDQIKAAQIANDAQMTKLNEMNNLKQQQQQLIHDANTAAKEAAYMANEKYHSLESEVKTLRSEIATIKERINRIKFDIRDHYDRLETNNNSIELLRREWMTLNSTEYTGDDLCPHCGQVLTENLRAKARELFNKAKQSKLEDIDNRGYKIKNHIEQTKKDIEAKQAELYSQCSTLSKVESILSIKQAEFVQFEIAPFEEVDPKTIPAYAELSVLIEDLKREVLEIKHADTDELVAQKKQIGTEIDSAKTELSRRGTIIMYTAEIEALKKQGKDLAQQIADAEREEYTIQNFTKAKINECERRINGLFSMVKFKLFDYTIDGNESETCIPLVDGVPFPSVNTAGKVNAGLDIINSLTRFYEVSAPIFIDGRESVNNLIPTQSQVINLVVSNDKQLVIK